ncbi:hypothetical protein [Methylobacterium sp. D54C]
MLVAVVIEYHSFVVHSVTNDSADRAQLSSMAARSNLAMKANKLNEAAGWDLYSVNSSRPANAPTFV